MYFLIYLIDLLILCVDPTLPVLPGVSSYFASLISQHTGVSNAGEITDMKCCPCIVGGCVN